MSGHLADVCSLEQLDIRTLGRYDVVSVSRPQANRRLLTLLARCGQLGIHTVADIDDLIFVPELADQSMLVTEGHASSDNVRASYTRHKLALQHFDEVTVSTHELARYRREQAPTQSIHVLANGLSQYWLDRNSLLSKAHPSKPKQLIYISGKRSQGQDLDSVKANITAFLHQHENSELSVTGAIQLDDWELTNEKLSQAVWADPMDLPLRICQGWANIAPYLNTPENKAKSHISFIESAAFGVPSICSPIDDITQHDVPGLLIADTEQQWNDALEKLLDATYYEKAQSALLHYAKEHCTAYVATQETLQRWLALNEQSENENFTALSRTG